MSARPASLPSGPGLDRRMAELYASGAEFGTAAPRLRDLRSVELRSGPIFSNREFVDRLRDRHVSLGAGPASLASIEALAGGASCVITGQQPHLLTGPLYTLWKILGAVALADRLSELHDRLVVPVWWCGSDDSDFAEVSSAWLFDHQGGPWRVRMPSSAHDAGMQVGGIGRGSLAALEASALQGLQGAGVGRLRDWAAAIPDTGLADRAAGWVLRFFARSGLVVIDARDEVLLREARPWMERYVPRRAEIAEAVRAQNGSALDPAARESGIFAVSDGRRVKASPRELDAGTLAGRTWGPSVLLRAVLQDALLAPAAAVLGPGELRYHAEIAPVYDLMGVQAARPVPRPHVTLVGRGWNLPDDDGALSRILSGGARAAAELARLQLPRPHSEAFDSFAEELDRSLQTLESRLGHPLDDRTRGRFAREARRLRMAEAELGGGRIQRRLEWLARGSVPQERLYSSWLVPAWIQDPWAGVLEPIASAWLDAVDRAGPVHWMLALEEIA